MKKRMFFALLSVCLEVSCCSSAFAADTNVQKNSGYVEIDCPDGYDEEVKLDGEKVNFYDAPVSVALHANEESNDSSPVCQIDASDFVEISDDDYDCVECELVAIDDDTYEVVTPEGKMLGVLHLGISENYAIPYSTQYTINWSANSNKIVHATTYTDAPAGTILTFSIYTTPTGASRFGVYHYDDGKFYYVDDQTWYSSIEGNFTVSESLGPIAPALWNKSDHAITYSGSCTIG